MAITTTLIDQWTTAGHAFETLGHPSFSARGGWRLRVWDLPKPIQALMPKRSDGRQWSLVAGRPLRLHNRVKGYTNVTTAPTGTVLAGMHPEMRPSRAEPTDPFNWILWFRADAWALLDEWQSGYRQVLRDTIRRLENLWNFTSSASATARFWYLWDEEVLQVEARLLKEAQTISGVQVRGDGIRTAVWDPGRKRLAVFGEAAAAERYWLTHDPGFHRAMRLTWPEVCWSCGGTHEDGECPSEDVFTQLQLRLISRHGIQLHEETTGGVHVTFPGKHEAYLPVPFYSLDPDATEEGILLEWQGRKQMGFA